MDATKRIERALGAALACAEEPGGPPRLAAAMRYAVFPQGARIRPRLCLAVAAACGEDDPALAEAAAAAIELLHCASLVHDDLPCFDDAPTRRGKPAVHRAFGEELAVLAGDALIVLAFQTVAQSARRSPQRLGAVIGAIAHAVGAPLGIAAGQAWECERMIDLAAYQQAKTGALFAAATVIGALAAGHRGDAWRSLGEHLGEAYQVADDIRDVTGDPDELGKPVGQDLAHRRPNAVQALGLAGAVQRLRGLVAQAADAIPACAGQAELRSLILLESRRLLPIGLAQQAA